MDKQKQIEEMAKLIQQDMCGDIPCEECNYHGKMKILPRYCGTYLIVEKLYNAGYRKIPENAVVLSREEYQQHKGFSREEVDEISETAIKNSRKNTVDKFAKKVHNLFNRDIKDSVVYTQEEKDILKEFVESIYEICKELTDGEKEISNETV